MKGETFVVFRLVTGFDLPRRNFISDKETVWIAISNMYHDNTGIEANVDLEAHIKSQFPPGFKIAKMDKPLRSPLSVTRRLKEEVSKDKTRRLSLNNRFLQTCTLPSNMAEGSIIPFGHTRLELLAQVLQRGFATVRDNYALIVVNDRKTAHANHLMKDRIPSGDECQGKLIVLATIAALHSIGRPNAKVYSNSWSHAIEEIIEWLSDATKRKGDLVVSMDLMAGFELAIIMDLTGGLAAVATRTLANVIVIYSNPVLDQQWLIQNVLKPGHDCKNIMDWTSTKTKIPSSIESLIGNMYNLEFYNSFLV